MKFCNLIGAAIIVVARTSGVCVSHHADPSLAQWVWLRQTIPVVITHSILKRFRLAVIPG